MWYFFSSIYLFIGLLSGIPILFTRLAATAGSAHGIWPLVDLPDASGLIDRIFTSRWLSQVAGMYPRFAGQVVTGRVGVSKVYMDGDGERKWKK